MVISRGFNEGLDSSLAAILPAPGTAACVTHSLTSADPVVAHPSLWKLAGDTAFCWHWLSTKSGLQAQFSRELVE